MHVFSMNHIIHLPLYRKQPGIFKIKFIEETVLNLAEENMVLISEEFKHILMSLLSRCNETVCVVLIRLTANGFCYKVAHEKRKYLFVRFETQSIPS